MMAKQKKTASKKEKSSGKAPAEKKSKSGPEKSGKKNALKNDRKLSPKTGKKEEEKKAKAKIKKPGKGKAAVKTGAKTTVPEKTASKSATKKMTVKTAAAKKTAAKKKSTGGKAVAGKIASAGKKPARKPVPKKKPASAKTRTTIPPLEEPIIAAPVMEPSELSEVANIEEVLITDLSDPSHDADGETFTEITVIESRIIFPEEKNDPVPGEFKEKPRDPFHGQNNPVEGKNGSILLPKKPLGGSRKK